LGRNSLWSWATGSSLLLYCYSGSIVVTGRRRLSLLWPVVAMGKVTSVVGASLRLRAKATSRDPRYLEPCFHVFLVALQEAECTEGP
jgi:hypothetical protein